MKKILLALPLVAGASWAGSTYYAGTQAQPAYEKLLADLNEAAVNVLVLETEEYTAGFTSSTAITNVKLQGLPEPVMFKLKHDIQHTPIGSDPQGARFSASSIVTTLMQEEITNKSVLEFVTSFEGGQPFVLYSDVAFSGNVSSDLQINKVSVDGESGTFEFGGGRYELVSSENKIDIKGVLGQFSFMDAQGAGGITVAESSSHFDLVPVGKGLYTGEQTMTFPSVSVKNQMLGHDVEISDIVFDSVSALTGDRVNSETSVSVAAIDSPMPLNSMRWDIILNGLSVEGFEKYMATMNKLSAMNPEDWENKDVFEAELQEAFAGLLSPGTEFINKVTLTNDGGDVVSDMNISFLGDGSASGLETVTTVGDLLRAITVSVDLNADAPAIDMTPAAMFMMHPMAQEFIVSDGQSYTSAINIADLMLEINGNVQSLDAMMGDELNQPLDFSSAMADY